MWMLVAGDTLWGSLGLSTHDSKTRDCGGLGWTVVDKAT